MRTVQSGIEPVAVRLPVQADAGRGPEWLSDPPSLRVQCSALRIKAMQLTQLLPDESLRAIACHDHVRALQLRFEIRPPRAVPDVMRSPAGTAMEKSDFLVALLRACGMPARLRVYSVRAHHLRGLVDDVETVVHPIVEVSIKRRWVAVDTHHLDVALAIGGRTKLLREGARCGYGLHLDGAAFWNGRDDALSLFCAHDPRTIPIRDWGVFHDAAQFTELAHGLRHGTADHATPFAALKLSSRVRRLRGSAT